MDFELTDEQVELQRIAREVVEREIPPSLVRSVVEDDADTSRALEDPRRPRVARAHRPRRCTAAAAPPSWSWPSCSSSWAGRPTPHPVLATTTQHLPLVRDALRGEVRDRRLAAIAGGSPGAAVLDADAVAARRDGDAWVLDGTAAHVLDADRADELAVVARADDGLGVFLIPADAASVTREPSVDASLHLATVHLDGVTVPADRAATGPDGRPKPWPGLAGGGAHRARGGDGRRRAAHVRPRARPHPPAPPVRRADRLVPGRQAHGRRRVRRHRASPGHRPLRRLSRSPRATSGATWRRRWPRPPPATPSASPPSTASSCSAAWATRGRTTSSSTCAGPRPARCCSAAPTSTAWR